MKDTAGYARRTHKLRSAKHPFTRTCNCLQTKNLTTTALYGHSMQSWRSAGSDGRSGWMAKDRQGNMCLKRDMIIYIYMCVCVCA